MPSLADATRARRNRERRRLVIGVGALLAGALLVGLGTAGVVSGAPTKTGAVVGGLVVLAVLVGLLVRAPLGARERTIAGAGVGVGLASLVVVWAAAPAALLSGRTAATVVGAAGYAVGLTVVLAAVLAGVTIRRMVPRERTGSGEVSWTRSDPGTLAHERAADGGRKDEELSFPLEDD